MTSPASSTWNDTGCLLCGAPEDVGHEQTCPGSRPEELFHLREQLPDGTTRSWSMAGVRFTAAEDRRTRLAALMQTATWTPARPFIAVPFSLGIDLIQTGLIEHVASTADVDGTFTFPNCGCLDPFRCRCGLPGHPLAEGSIGPAANASLSAIRLRLEPGWITVWMLETDSEIVAIAEDKLDDPRSPDTSRECAKGWCDDCPAAGGQAVDITCRHGCHRDRPAHLPADRSTKPPNEPALSAPIAASGGDHHDAL